MPTATQSRSTDAAARPDATKPLVVLTRQGVAADAEPCTVGIPFPQGALRDAGELSLAGPAGDPVTLQAEPLAFWPDQSIRWLLLDWVARSAPPGESHWSLSVGRPTPSIERKVLVRQTPSGVVVDTGVASFELDAGEPGVEAPEGRPTRFVFRDGAGRSRPAVVERFQVVTEGPARATVEWEGRFGRRSTCRFVARFCFFAGTGLVRARVTLHNPRRARHRGGLWDLGDAGSVRFRELTLEVPAGGTTTFALEPGTPTETVEGDLEIYQGSSGGENWQSRNHVDESGQVRVPFHGCRVRHGARESTIARPSPTVVVRDASHPVAVAVPEFWQQFPKSLAVTGGRLRIGLFPGDWPAAHELQGGEQKTHTVWLDFASGTESSLRWAHTPASVRVPRGWLKQSGALPAWAFPGDEDDRFRTLMAGAVDGERGLRARGEAIDEYGWRSFGDLYADHEAAYYTGPKPVVSHYNNQYDVVWGALLQWWRTGDSRWLAVADPLARHVIDIDLYHTSEDKAAYNGGLFWHTDHYRDAATASHRAFSAANQAPGKPYGGGPCNEHNYTTGLLHYHYLTGDPQARAAVLSLADWVVAMDDGARNVFGLIDDGRTGLASCTAEADYHGPGRGCGNSVNALLDAWQLTDELGYLAKAEELIRRSIHPADDIASRDLLNVEMRWSYTVFLTVLARYLDLKAEAGQVDEAHTYARASLLHYAEWMAAHEVPYFDQVDRLAFPTETWAAQEMRKANVLRLAAAHAPAPRPRLLNRAAELADRAWADLHRFPVPDTTRALAILMVEGLKDSWARSEGPRPAQTAPAAADWSDPVPFVPQRQRIRARLRSLAGLASAAVRLLDPRRWRPALFFRR